jgi:hypothetical protein
MTKISISVIVTIAIAIIGFAFYLGGLDARIASLASASGRVAARAEIKEERQRMSGGTIGSDFTVKSRIGRAFKVDEEKSGVGTVRIVFKDSFDKTPIVLVTPHSGEHATAIIRLRSIALDSVVFTIRHMNTNAEMADEFSFMVLESISETP